MSKRFPAFAFFLALAVWPRQGVSGELHNAAIAGDIESVLELLDAGVPVDAADPNGTPLIWALFGQQAEIARILVERGANPNAKSPNGWSPLVSAIKMGDADLIEALLSNGADPSSGEVLTPLAAAAEEGQAAFVTQLLEAGADATHRLNEDWTALHFATSVGDLEISSMLIQADADVNALTVAGHPPIHFALQGGFYDIALALRDAGARPTAVEPVTPYLTRVEAADPDGIVALRCLWCHENKPGVDIYPEPNLWNVVNRPIGSLADEPVSPAIHAIGDVWDYETLNKFIARPTEYAPGTTMNLFGILDVEERASIILYLRSLADTPAPLPEP